jgi:hypothetical protein
MISTIQDYFNKCVIPKIESDLEADAISTLKQISNFIPYSLEIKEASDIVMIVKDLYNFVNAYNSYPSPNFSNAGYALGGMAYYIVQMSEGHGMFGWVRVENKMLGTSNDTWTPEYLKGGEAMLGQSNKTYTPMWIQNKTDPMLIQAI